MIAVVSASFSLVNWAFCSYWVISAAPRMCCISTAKCKKMLKRSSTHFINLILIYISLAKFSSMVIIFFFLCQLTMIVSFLISLPPSPTRGYLCHFLHGTVSWELCVKIPRSQCVTRWQKCQMTDYKAWPKPCFKRGQPVYSCHCYHHNRGGYFRRRRPLWWQPD